MKTIRLISCTIECGAFSSERMFEIKQPAGSVIGVANVSYLLDQNYRRLPDAQLSPDEKIDGFVHCRVIRAVGSHESLIEVPSSDLIKVLNSELSSIPDDTLVA